VIPSHIEEDAMAGLLSRERIVARPGFNRWLVPPAALAIHLSIGMAYGFSVFWLPLSRAIGITEPVPCPKTMSFISQIFATNCDWKISTLGWMYTLFFVCLGSSAAIFGRWLEHAGPRKAGVVAAFCWGGGFMISALGVHLHQIWLLWLGSGVIGGCGLGLGYISPVSTLIKWFPDRRGMATGMAIMGFGGGALIGAPLADLLMKHYATPTSVGVKETFITMGVIYFVAMMAGAFGYRVPQPGWTVAARVPRHRPLTTEHAALRGGMITARHVHVDVAWKTPQFWLLWGVLWMNVSAGIGVIGIASPMIQEVFGGRLIDLPGVAFKALTEAQKAQTATLGAAFAALLSLFNIAGRISWASASDYLGRKRTYFIFFALGFLLYASVPSAAGIGSKVLFVALFCVILTMYGGGFATIPAYLADIFGTQFVGAIHGRLLTAWSAAGILGPVLVNYIREYQLGHGVPAAQAYNVTMYVLAGLLVLGFFCNLAVRPVADRYYMSDQDVAREAGGGPGMRRTG
jgi:MFS family permease